MQQGFCSHCRRGDQQVERVRIFGLGLRFLDAICIERLQGLGMDIERVVAVEPRVADQGPSARRRDRITWPLRVRGAVAA